MHQKAKAETLPFSVRCGSAFLALILLASLGMGPLVIINHRRPTQLYTYLMESGALLDREGRRDVVKGAGNGGDDLRLTIELPGDVAKFCERYAAGKRLTLESFIRLIVMQGVAATAEAERDP